MRSCYLPRSVGALLITLLTLVACGQGSPSPTSPEQELDASGNPFAARAQTVVPSPRLSAAILQAEGDGDTSRAELLQRLVDVPTGVWLTPEALPIGAVGQRISSVLAIDQGATVPLFVIYGIPDRDCTGGFSSGGLKPTTYLPWVREIADAAGSRSAVVLEPDALAASLECDQRAERIRLLTEAVDVLDAADVTTYVDAGHSDWVPVDQMASLLTEVGVGDVRGFATNVANYQPLALEKQFAAELSTRLNGARYLIDTGRDGASSSTGQPVDDWCNPLNQALGQAPGFVDDQSGLDALLWVKPPAESDGTCHGGPAAGEIWLTRAISLAENAGW